MTASADSSDEQRSEPEVVVKADAEEPEIPVEDRAEQAQSPNGDMR